MTRSSWRPATSKGSPPRIASDQGLPVVRGFSSDSDPGPAKSTTTASGRNAAIASRLADRGRVAASIAARTSLRVAPEYEVRGSGRRKTPLASIGSMWKRPEDASAQ